MTSVVLITVLLWIHVLIVSMMMVSTLSGRAAVVQEARNSARMRSGGCCEDCGVVSHALECHHVSYRRVGHEVAEDYAVLCRECHRRRHLDLNGEWWTDPEEHRCYWSSYWSEVENG